ncbi:hypothetical protein CQW23_33484 [Capsicum baccatum]|uniref:Uncharacterized protein n=1 Tax=Capsicum baccatum TaxID=33114 RepID=A0A2G2V1R2_CAPBA|nr:hypothetical protein CQW23_33484 [Capsicum baccatum]
MKKVVDGLSTDDVWTRLEELQLGVEEPELSPEQLRINDQAQEDEIHVHIEVPDELTVSVKERLDPYTGPLKNLLYLVTVIREVPLRATPIQFLRELEKLVRVKFRIHLTACHLRSAVYSEFRNLSYSIPIKELTKGMSGTGGLVDAVQVAETLGTTGRRWNEEQNFMTAFL